MEHCPSPDHPERPERLRSMVRALKKEGLWNRGGTVVIDPPSASIKDIELIHDPAYVEKVKKLSSSERMLDLDTPTDRKTFDIARLAAGGTIVAGEKVVKGEVDNSFALVRPPGYHAGIKSGGGFCYFNNVAIMVERLKRDLERIMIFDFNAHHGNGTQQAFYGDGKVLFISVHQNGRTLYPDTGFSHEFGEGDGEGYTVNLPMPPGSSDKEYVSVMEEIFNPLAKDFDPGLIVASVGMDVHVQDPLTQLQLSSTAYGWIARIVVERAKEMCKGRCVLALEGGYAVGVVGEIALNVVKALLGEKMPRPSKESPPPSLKEAKDTLSNYWEF